MTGIDAHNEEIHANLENWKRKPLLQDLYRGFHKRISEQLTDSVEGPVVELGSGVADITEVVPGCIRTDLFPNPWIDQQENAYQLSFEDQSVSNIILFDVFHHLRYPGSALKELHRVLVPGGRVIIFDPCMSLMGRWIFGALHQEPIALRDEITWTAPEGWGPMDIDYYAAQGNASRIFVRKEIPLDSVGLSLLKTCRFSAFSYVASGGYSGPQLYPKAFLPLMRGVDAVLNVLPVLFATRLLVVLEKTQVP